MKQASPDYLQDKTDSYRVELTILLFGHVEFYKILNYQDLKLWLWWRLKVVGGKLTIIVTN